MKLSHWSVRYHALQRLDRVSGVKRNLRPFQVQLLLAEPPTKRGQRSRNQAGGCLPNEI